MEELGMCIAVVGLVIMTGIAGVWVGQEKAMLEMKQELFDRGHMIQCLGKNGYYWECE